MKIINNYGLLYRLSERNYIKLLRAWAAGNDCEFSRYGKCIGQVDCNMTDLSQEDAQEQLKYLAEEKKTS